MKSNWNCKAVLEAKRQSDYVHTVTVLFEVNTLTGKGHATCCFIKDIQSYARLQEPQCPSRTSYGDDDSGDMYDIYLNPVAHCVKPKCFFSAQNLIYKH